MEQITVNGKAYDIIKLLGKGKGGYSYLAGDGDVKVVLKQIHHEPCDYYKFGNKIEAEINDYNRLKNIGISLPEMIDVDIHEERIVKEFIDGKTAYEMILNDELPQYCIDYECNNYSDEWNFENWGIKYWSRTPEFMKYANTNK